MTDLTQNPFVDLILPLFTGRDLMRPAMCQIHGSDDGFIYATDAHIAIKVSQKLSVRVYPKVDNYPDIAKFFADYEETINQAPNIRKIVTSAEQLALTFSKLEGKFYYEKIKKQCPNCGGEGSLKCDHCYNDGTCRECNGTGEQDKNQSFLERMRFAAHEEFSGATDYVEIDEAYVKPGFLSNVIMAIMALRSETIHIYSPKENTLLFKCMATGVEIILMANYLSNPEDYKIIAL